MPAEPSGRVLMMTRVHRGLGIPDTRSAAGPIHLSVIVYPGIRRVVPWYGHRHRVSGVG